MNKIYKLFINENIKTWKKFSTKLALILCILALIGILALVHFMKYDEEKSKEEFYQIYNSSNWREYIEEGIEFDKQTLLDETLSEFERGRIKSGMKANELMLEYDINPSSSYWKKTIISRVMISPQIDEKLLKVLENDDFKGYIQYQRDEYKKMLDTKQISQEEYDDEMLIQDLYEKYEIGKEPLINNVDWREMAISEIRDMQTSLRNGKDIITNKVLTVEKMHEYEDQIKMDIYRIENDMPSLEFADMQSFRMLFETFSINFITGVIAIFAIVIAGGAISSEISAGTIKFWALTPNKRWKILTAKILSLLFYIVVITLIMATLTIVCGNIFFNSQGNEYIYIKDGNVEKMGNTLFVISSYFAKIIPIIFFAVLALMLSVLTRVSAFAVSVSIGIYMGIGTVMTVLSSFITKDWMKFIPFNNLKIFEKIFPNFESLTGVTETISTTTSLEFSFAVLGVCMVLMLVTAYDSFNNRDIV